MINRENKIESLKSYLISLGNVALWSYNKNNLDYNSISIELLVEKILLFGNESSKKDLIQVISKKKIEEVLMNNLCLGRYEDKAISLSKELFQKSDPKRYIKKLQKKRLEYLCRE